MIEVDLPDGSVAEFPDGTAPDVIKGALRKRFNMPPVAEDAGMFKNASGVSGEAGVGPLTADEQTSNREGKSNRADAQPEPFPRVKWDMQGEIVDMISFGLAKKLASGANATFDATGNALRGGPFNIGERYNNELEEFQAAQRDYGEQHPYRKLAGQGLGLGMGIAKLPAVAIGTKLGLTGTGAKLADAAATGFTYGGISGAARDADSLEERAKNTAEGGFWGGMVAPLAIPASKAIGSVVAAIKKRGLPVPSIDELRQAAQSAYQRADDAGIQIAQPAYAKAANDLAALADQSGFHPRLHPRIGVALDEIQALASGAPTLQKVEQVRRIIGTAGNSVDADERRLASVLKEGLDDFVTGLPDEALAAGDKAGIGALTEARNLWSRVRQSEMLSEAVEKASRRGETNYNSNVEQATKQNFRQILDNPKKTRGMSPDLLQAVERAAKGNRAQRALSWAGKAAPKGAVSSIPSIMVGSTFGTIPGIALALGGAGAKALSSGVTNSLVRTAQATAQRGGAAPKVDTQQLEAVIRALLSVQAGRAGGQLAGQ